MACTFASNRSKLQLLVPEDTVANLPLGTYQMQVEVTNVFGQKATAMHSFDMQVR